MGISSRYWRLLVHAVDGGAYASIGEFYLYASTDGTGTNLATGTASQQGDGSVGPASAGISGSTGDEAGSSFSPGTPWWWALDLGSALEIGSIAFTAQRSVPDRTPKDFDLQTSADGSTWATIISYTGETGWIQYERRAFGAVAYAISGTVTYAGTPLEATVRLYHRATGAFVEETTSDETTGAYSFQIASPDEHQVVVLDPAGGVTVNDKIQRATGVST